MREPRPDLARPALAYIKKHPAGSEPAGLYIINQGGVAGLSRHAVDAPPRVINMKKKYCGSRGKFFLCFFLHILLLCLAMCRRPWWFLLPM